MPLQHCTLRPFSTPPPTKWWHSSTWGWGGKGLTSPMLSIIWPWARLLSEKHRMTISQKYWFKFSSFTPLTNLVFEEPHNCAAQWTSHKALRLIGVVQKPDLQGNGSCSQLQRLLQCFCFPVPHVQTGAIFPWTQICIGNDSQNKKGILSVWIG